MITKTVKLENLYFDPNNFRYADDFSHIVIPDDRIIQVGNQKPIFNKLKKDISSLIDVIMENDFIYIEMIIVKELSNNNYFVIEGNRRLAVLKYIQENYAIEDLKPNLKKIMESGLEVKVNNSLYDNDILMAMRHISGVKSWNGFAKAKLITKLKEVNEYSFQEISVKIEKEVYNIKKQYYSFKLLQQMEEAEYSILEIKDLYSIFFETLTNQQFKKWLDWNEETGRCHNEANLNRFYQWIIKVEDENGKKLSEIISNPQGLREVSKILNDEYALNILETKRNIFEAVQQSVILKEKDLNKTLQKILDSLNTINTSDLKRLSEKQENLLNEIYEIAQNNNAVIELFKSKK